MRPSCPLDDCEADADQVDASFDRHRGEPEEVSEVLACDEGHQATVRYVEPLLEEVHSL